jgi:uncharacterized protein YciI
MEYFFYCRDRPGTGELRWQLTETHWSFMDKYATAMIARGPTLAADGEAVTGSMHIVDLPDSHAAQVFAFDEPNYKAGVYGEVLVRRWRSTLGRTMWDFPASPGDENRFLVIGHANRGMTAAHEALREEHRFYLAAGGYRERLIACGSLLSDDGPDWMGTAMLVQLPDRDSAEALVTHGPYARAGLYDIVEVHSWRFGGRPQQ